MTSCSNASVGAVARVGIRVSCTNADAGGGTEDAQWDSWWLLQRVLFHAGVH